MPSSSEHSGPSGTEPDIQRGPARFARTLILILGLAVLVAGGFAVLWLSESRERSDLEARLEDVEQLAERQSRTLDMNKGYREAMAEELAESKDINKGYRDAMAEELAASKESLKSAVEAAQSINESLLEELAVSKESLKSTIEAAQSISESLLEELDALATEQLLLRTEPFFGSTEAVAFTKEYWEANKVRYANEVRCGGRVAPCDDEVLNRVAWNYHEECMRSRPRDLWREECGPWSNSQQAGRGMFVGFIRLAMEGDWTAEWEPSTRSWNLLGRHKAFEWSFRLFEATLAVEVLPHLGCPEHPASPTPPGFSHC